MGRVVTLGDAMLLSLERRLDELIAEIDAVLIENDFAALHAINLALAVRKGAQAPGMGGGLVKSKAAISDSPEPISPMPAHGKSAREHPRAGRPLVTANLIANLALIVTVVALGALGIPLLAFLIWSVS
jgi:hypothetical protein